MLRGFYEKGVETEYKGDVDLVTEADQDQREASRGAAEGGVSNAWGVWRGGDAGQARELSIGGMSIRWMGRRTLRMGFRRSA